MVATVGLEPTTIGGHSNILPLNYVAKKNAD